MRMPERMKATMIAMPSAKKRIRRMEVPYSPSANRLPNAQPPANAAPNTSAEIRIAADSTVDTLTQLMRRLPFGWLVASSMRRNEYERCGPIKGVCRGGVTHLHCGEHWRFRADGCEPA